MSNWNWIFIGMLLLIVVGVIYSGYDITRNDLNLASECEKGTIKHCYEICEESYRDKDYCLDYVDDIKREREVLGVEG